MRMGHQNKRHIKNVIEEELCVKVHVNNETCEGCIYDKTHRPRFGTLERATAPGDLIHAVHLKNSQLGAIATSYFSKTIFQGSVFCF
jgi:hypothetical protein